MENSNASFSMSLPPPTNSTNLPSPKAKIFSEFPPYLYKPMLVFPVL